MKKLLLFSTILFLSLTTKAGNYYWVNGTGNWSDYAAHWATTSGGNIFHVQVPTPFDSVFFDANSFPTSSDTVYIDSTIINCNTLDFSAATNSPVLQGSSGEFHIYGSFLIHGNVIWNIPAIVRFESSNTGNIINTAGARLFNYSSNAFTHFSFNGTGNWTLQSDLNLDSTAHSGATGGNVTIESGTLFTNGYTISCQQFAFQNSGNAFFGSSHITCNRWDGVSNLIADSSTIDCQFQFEGGGRNKFNDVNAYQIEFADSCVFHDVRVVSLDMSQHLRTCVFHNVVLLDSSNTYLTSSINAIFNKLTVESPSFHLSGPNNFDTLVFLPGVTATIQGTQTVNSFIQIDGSCSGLNVINGGTINKTSGSVVLNYVMLQNITATGGATFTANNSIDNGNVTGITVNAPAPIDLYWVGGTGNWNDVSHWASTSGGAGGSCVPSAVNNVYFDANSFSSPGDTVYLNVLNAYCKTFDCSGATNNPVFQCRNAEFYIYGSFIIHGNVRWNAPTIVWFQSSATGNIINTSGARFFNYSTNAFTHFAFNGTGNWTLQSDLILDSTAHSSATGGNVTIESGTLFTNGYTISCQQFAFQNSGNAFFGSSHITCNRWDGVSNLIADSSTIDCQFQFEGGGRNKFNDVNAYQIEFADSCVFHDVRVVSLDMSQHLRTCVFHNVVLLDSSNTYLTSSINAIFNKLTVESPSFHLSGPNNFDTLVFLPGVTATIQGTQTINSLLLISSDPGFPTSLHGPATINYPDTLCTDFIYLQNINAMGGQFFAGMHSVDLGGNTGWQFSSCSPVFSNVWPGDANYDLVVDNFDLLYIGVAYGDTGFVRAGASNAFTAQPCEDWFYQFINGTNVKKADSDGNGIVDGADSTAVSLNYGLTHPFRIPYQNVTNTVGTELSLQIPPGLVTPGTVVNIPIMLGSLINPANNVYGIAFTINYDIGLVQSGTLNIDFSGSWIESSNNHLSLVKDFPFAGKCDVAFTRINKTDISGNGQIGTLTFTIPTNAYGYLNLSFSKIKLISHNEIDIPVSVHTDSLNTSVSEISVGQLSIYPNPSSGKLHVQFINKDHNKCLVTIFDSKGQNVYSEFTSNDVCDINTKDFVSGIYFMVIRNSESGRSFEGKILVE